MVTNTGEIITNYHKESVHQVPAYRGWMVGVHMGRQVGCNRVLHQRDAEFGRDFGVARGDRSGYEYHHIGVVVISDRATATINIVNN